MPRFEPVPEDSLRTYKVTAKLMVTYEVSAETILARCAAEDVLDGWAAWSVVSKDGRPVAEIVDASIEDLEVA
jgi:hypothetical protein